MDWLTAISFPLAVAAVWILAITKMPPHAPNPINSQKILLLISHPDDEAMFFAPTLLAITKPELRNEVRVVCLSSGNADGLGQVREGELLESCRLLGVKCAREAETEGNSRGYEGDKRVVVVDRDDLPDSMTAHWPASTISSVLHSLFPTDSDFYPTVLLTFDSSGISSHPNHISARLGAKEYIASLPLASPRPALYTLTTIPIYRKYLSWFDLISTILFPPSPSPEINAQKEEGKLPARLVFMSGWEDFKTARAAMTQAHVSQMRWFRYGWILWSRYMVINELRLEGHGKKER